MAAPSLIPKSDAKPKDRVDIRLYNTIAIFDVYTVARTGETAREALLNAIINGDAKPTELTSREVTMPNSIRSSWTDQSPFVAADITDEEFETLKGITTGAAFERFYLKR